MPLLRRRLLAVLLALCVTPEAAAANAALTVSEFAARGLEGWQERSFDGHTRYRIVDDDGRRVLDATSRGSASGLFRRLDNVDLATTPLLTWSWWIDEPVPSRDVRQRAGDDFAARVYVVFSGGWRFWTTTTLVYVWAHAEAPEEPWRNPFTEQAAVIPVRGGGRWHEERRDVAADYQRAFGKDPPPVEAVAVMTDTDQTGAAAHARYADLRFVARPESSSQRRSLTRLDSRRQTGEIPQPGNAPATRSSP